MTAIGKKYRGWIYRAQGRRLLCSLLMCALALGSSPSAPPQRLADEGSASLTVLNFVNRNPGDGWDWLGKGLADMLITDLSKSASLVVVERDRMAQMLTELELAERGIADASTAGRLGRFSKVDWVLFGSYIKEDEQLRIEAHVVDVESGRLLRAELVEGRIAELFTLERELVYGILSRLDVPVSEEERRAIEKLPTDSMPAFEHYSRCLEHFDRGEWFEALLESRLAVRQDQQFVKAATRVADLYTEVGEPAHAAVEYRKLAAAETQNALPEITYYRFGRISETSGDKVTAVMAYERILARHPEDFPDYDMDLEAEERVYRAQQEVLRQASLPLQQKRTLTDAERQEYLRLQIERSRGPDQGSAFVKQHYSGLQALERLAIINAELSRGLASARYYSRIIHALRRTHAYGRAGELCDRVKTNYCPVYWESVRENRDSELCPPILVYHIPEGGDSLSEPGPSTPRTKPGFGYQRSRTVLAPPGEEIAELTAAIDCTHYSTQVTWSDPGRRYPATVGAWGFRRFEKGSGWQTARFDLPPGIRVLKVFVHFSPNWRAEFKLRPWSGLKTSQPAVAGFGVRIDPEWADAIILDGKQISGPEPVREGIGCTGIPAGDHVVEVVWPDGRRTSKKFHLEPGTYTGMFLTPDKRVISRHVLASAGSYTYLFLDRQGLLWLLWDQAVESDLSMHPSQESDIFCATSTDGADWSNPKRLPVSSSALDMQPILQQDRRGSYWLIWISSRDPKDPKWLWIASSGDGANWSFPRKVVLPISDEHDVDLWRETHVPRFGFTIDLRNTFWLVWQGRLFQSEDAQEWAEVDVLKTKGRERPDNMSTFLEYFLTHDRSNRLLLLASRSVRVPLTEAERESLIRHDPANTSRKTRHQYQVTLWRRTADARWQDLGSLAEDCAHPGSIYTTNDGRLYGASARSVGILLRTYSEPEGWSKDLMIESHLPGPFHPSIGNLPGGRWIVAYACKDGIVAAVVDPSSVEPQVQE